MNTKVLTIEEAKAYLNDLSPNECDRIAIEQGCMAIRVYSLRRPDHLTQGRRIDGWEPFWIPNNKSKDVWCLILGHQTARTAMLAHEGRIRRIQKEHRASRAVAERYVEAASAVRSGFEAEVIEVVLEAPAHFDAWDAFPGPNRAIPYWLRRHPQLDRLTHDRLVAANRIIKLMRGLPEVTEDGRKTIESFNSCCNNPIDLGHRGRTLIEQWAS